MRDPRLADGVVERDHAGHGGPPVLAEPPLRASGARACPRPAVRRAGVTVRAGEAVAGEDRRGAVGVREGEDRGEDVGVGWGGGGERVGFLHMCEWVSAEH